MTPRPAILLLLSCVLVLGSGCNVAGYIAATAPQKSKPTYTNLANQSITVMVWADPALRIDWPGLQLDLANSLQNKLASVKQEELKNTSYPVRPASVARYQLDHPEIESQPVTQVAPKLGVTRLIYLEIEDFTTRSVDSLELYRGSMTASLKIIEVDGKAARIGYEEDNIRAIFPPKAPAEGLPQGNDYKFYLGTVDAFSTEVMRRLIAMEIP